MLYHTLLFIGFLEAIACFALMSASTMKLRKPVKKHVLIALLAMAILISIFFLCLLIFGVSAVEVFAIAITLIIAVVWYWICSGDRFLVSCFQFLTFVNIYIAVGYLSDKLTTYDDRVLYNVQYIVIRLLLYAFIIPPLFKYVRPRFRRLVDSLDTEWRSALLVPFLFLALQISLLYYPFPYWNWQGDHWYIYISFIVYALFFAVYNLLYIQLSAIVKKNIMEKRELLMVQQNKLWEAEVARRQAAADLFIQQRHDMRHHNAVITSMLDEGLFEQLKTYMQDFTVALDKSDRVVYCQNNLINSICNVYGKRAAVYGIKTTFRAVVPKQLPGIDAIDLTCIFGNVLENAIEACQRLPAGEEREISMIVKYMDNRLRLQVKNSCMDDIVFDGELPVTNKQHGGGTGSKSIIYTAEQYDGTVGFCVREGEFITQIIINSRQNEAPSV